MRDENNEIKGWRGGRGAAEENVVPRLCGCFYRFQHQHEISLKTFMYNAYTLYDRGRYTRIKNHKLTSRQYF